jgi:hypothetical protein
MGDPGIRLGWALETTEMNPQVHQEKPNDVALDAALGLAIVFLLLLIGHWFEDTTVGQRLRGYFEVAVLTVTRPLNTPTPQVRIINLFGFPQLQPVKCAHDGDENAFVQPLDRAVLFKSIKAVASNANALPYSIGVDADFGPCGDGFVLARDADFFQQLLGLEQKVFGRRRTDAGVATGPIYLGTYRGGTASPRYWLNDKRFASLAASIGSPSRDPGRALVWAAPTGSTEKGYSLPARLAFPYVSPSPVKDGPWSSIRAQDEAYGSDADLQIRIAPIDFRTVATIGARIVSTRTKPKELIEDIQHEALAGGFSNQIVLFGTVHDSEDMHGVPGFGDQAGVIILGAGSNSMRTSWLYELTPTWRIAIDLTVSLCIVAIVALLRWVNLRRSRSINKTAVSVFLFTLCGAGLLIISVFLMVFGQIMWDDALLLGAFIAIHPFSEGWALRFGRWVSTTWIAFWNFLLDFGKRARTP